MGSKRLTIVEKLAREICWSGFMSPKAVGKTKAAYWKSISPKARADYIREAYRFAFLMRRVDFKILLELLGVEP